MRVAQEKYPKPINNLYVFFLEFLEILFEILLKTHCEYPVIQNEGPALEPVTMSEDVIKWYSSFSNP